MSSEKLNHDHNSNGDNATEEPEEKSFFKIIVHSFFIIPFLIAVFCLLLFAGMHLLTRENRNAYDYLADVKAGGKDKRWQSAFFISKMKENERFQGAFELSKFLSNPQHVPKEERFYNELESVFKASRHDDNRVRQYLALAMGRTENKRFTQVLINGLTDEKEENVAALIYSLGMLRDPEALDTLYEYLDHANARIRSVTVVAIGNIEDSSSRSKLKKALQDSEANVQWGAAISLANMDDVSGRDILLNLLNRQYLENYEEVDPEEQTQLILSAINAAGHLNDKILNERLTEISKNDRNMNVRSAALKVLEK
ncbi:MAG: HEAT repeat domain-containing protein [Candidatus Omnitrophica bacterium]|nr:HEAT repeat domain-containing protein [Candidatus Omnitrophota bacterium]